MNVTGAQELVLDGRRVFARRLGPGSGPLVVIEAALGSSSPEWWRLQEALAASVDTLSYDRAGYGRSDAPRAPRTGAQLASELAEVLDALGVHEPVVLVGHSLGGLLVRHFVARFPARVAGAVFVDPVSTQEHRWKELPPALVRRGGVDKGASLGLVRRLGRWRVLPLLRRLVTRGPPHRAFATDAGLAELLWADFLRREMHDAALGEYAHLGDAVPAGKLSAPVLLLTHDPEVVRAEIQRYGRLASADAARVDEFWLSLMKEVLALSADAEHHVVRGADHFLHLTQPGQVADELRRFVARLR
ncbi:MAG: alpha/beta fold hydrolase [Myxococcota bacterium]